MSSSADHDWYEEELRREGNEEEEQRRQEEEDYWWQLAEDGEDFEYGYGYAPQSPRTTGGCGCLVCCSPSSSCAP
jgi:hypothetical protein